MQDLRWTTTLAGLASLAAGVGIALGGDEPRRHLDHWAFRAPSDSALPRVRDTQWPTSPLDQFILAGLEANGMHPSAPADKRTLIRRATFDLTGLPPTPGEIDAFLHDEDADAFTHLVDRLLASPAYGERWGRHWLDIARYADSNGLDENVSHGNAWRYRDYVVASFNRDVPYDQFLVEQLAGDLLPAADFETRQRRLIATGFLALGPKVLAEVDEQKMEMDIVDEQIDTLGRALLGMTFGCARCHEHKFDPIDTEDYYALAGIFKSTRTMETFKKVARWHENSIGDEDQLAARADHERRVAGHKDAIAKLVSEADAAAKAAAAPDQPLPQKLESLYPEETKRDLKRLRDELEQLEKSAPELPSAMGVFEGNARNVAIHIRGSHLNLGEVVPRGVPRILAGETKARFDSPHSGRLELANWLASPEHPLTARVMVNRIWRWHFGHGLVRTPDNFGRLGEPPTHPELLDWLARRFVASGWSIKAMHRLVMISSTYQMSCIPNSLNAEGDPENRLFGRAKVRRLEAEAVRDALLAVAGTLDRSMGESLLQVKNRQYFFDHTSRDLTDYSSHRRAIYLPVVRNNLYDVFQLLDFPDAAVPSGDRPTTTIAPQALFMMNGDLVSQASLDLASRLFHEVTATDSDRVQRLILLAYGRPATEGEVASSLNFLVEAQRALELTQPAGAERVRQAWASLCQVILGANEFAYIR